MGYSALVEINVLGMWQEKGILSNLFPSFFMINNVTIIEPHL